MTRALHRIAHLAVALWVGAVAAVSFVVAPRVFAVLEREAAGDLMMPIFRYVDFFGVGAAALYLFVSSRSRARPIMAGVMGAAAAVNAWALGPRIAARAEHWELFHKISTGLWGGILVGGAILVLIGRPPVNR